MNCEYYYNYNWWKLELEELPTKGIFYNKNTIIKIRSLSVLEVKFLATLIPENATDVCNEILSKCLYLENIQLTEILKPDREYLIFWIRLNSFTQSSGYNININQCQNCKKSFTQTFSLNDFDVKYIKTQNLSVFLPDLNIEIGLKIPSFLDSKIKITGDIDNIALWIDTDNTINEKINFIENLSALDFLELKNGVENLSCGIDHKIKVECPHCKAENNAEIILNDDSLFGSVKLLNILETISRIAKYSNVQITNEWSWPEVEAEQIVINNMIKEENEANDKEIAKAKSQAAMAKSNAGSHISNVKY